MSRFADGHYSSSSSESAVMEGFIQTKPHIPAVTWPPPLHHGCRSDGFFFVNPQQDDDVSKKGIGKKDSFRRWSEVKYLQSSNVLTNRLDAADNALRTNDNLPKHVTGFNAVFHCQQGTVLDDSTGEEEEEEEDGGEAQHEEVDRSGFVCFCYT